MSSWGSALHVTHSSSGGKAFSSIDGAGGKPGAVQPAPPLQTKRSCSFARSEDSRGPRRFRPHVHVPGLEVQVWTRASPEPVTAIEILSPDSNSWDTCPGELAPMARPGPLLISTHADSVHAHTRTNGGHSMVRLAGTRRATLSDALASLSNDDLRAMMKSLSVPTPRPTRKADMVAAIESRLAGESLRSLWSGLDETQQCAVSEVLHDPDGEFHPDRFEAKYGTLPAGFGPVGALEASPLRLFLYPRGPLRRRAVRYPAGPRESPASIRSATRGSDSRRRGRAAAVGRHTPARLAPKG